MPPQPGSWPPSGYYPQQSGWGGPPPPKQNNTIKWLLIGVGLLLVIAITVGVTVLVTNGGPGGDGQSTTTSASGPPVASADDTGPVEIITSEPTCQAWMPASQAMSRVQENGWGDRDPAVPAADWTASERYQHEAVAKSLEDTAAQAVEFARQTPHRLIRELFEQFIYYSRAYAESIPTYAPKDDYLSLASVASSSALDALCDSITYGSAAARSTDVDAVEPPSELPSPKDPAAPDALISSPSSTCTEIIGLRERLITSTAEWVKQDPNIPASQWTPEQRSLSEGAAQAMANYADDVEALGRSSGDPRLQDLASFSAVYFRGYVSSVPTYVLADNYLLLAGSRTTNVVVTACQAVAA